MRTVNSGFLDIVHDSHECAVKCSGNNENLKIICFSIYEFREFRFDFKFGRKRFQIWG